MMTTRKPLSEEIIAKMKEEVSRGKSRNQIAKELNLSYKQVWKHTRDFHSKRGLPQEIREKIRQEVLSGKSKRRVSIELGVSEYTVQYYTGDLCLTPFRRINVQDRKLEFMKDLLRDGYALASDKYGSQEYFKLKEHFPAISRIKTRGRVIYFLEGKEDVAAKVFLERMQRKIISYQELKQITKVFRADLPKREKHAFFLRNRQMNPFKKRGVQKGRSLREKGDSFSFFYIRRYWQSVVPKVGLEFWEVYHASPSMTVSKK
jgi:DNA-binding CsgD family transcriptional regulator